MFGLSKKAEMVSADAALPGRAQAMPVPAKHYVLGTDMVAPWPQGMEVAIFGMGCFWGAERTFWQAEGVYSTQVGYAAGFTPNPSYEEVCSGYTGHTETVLVIYDEGEVSTLSCLKVFGKGMILRRVCGKGMILVHSTGHQFMLTMNNNFNSRSRLEMFIRTP